MSVASQPCVLQWTNDTTLVAGPAKEISLCCDICLAKGSVSQSLSVRIRSVQLDLSGLNLKARWVPFISPICWFLVCQWGGLGLGFNRRESLVYRYQRNSSMNVVNGYYIIEDDTGAIGIHLYFVNKRWLLLQLDRTTSNTNSCYHALSCSFRHNIWELWDNTTWLLWQLGDSSGERIINIQRLHNRGKCWDKNWENKFRETVGDQHQHAANKPLKIHNNIQYLHSYRMLLFCTQRIKTENERFKLMQRINKTSTTIKESQSNFFSVSNYKKIYKHKIILFVVFYLQ